MKINMIHRFIIAVVLLFATTQYSICAKQEYSHATAKEITKNLLTYAYDSPREYYSPGRLYPYHRFDSFSAKGKMQKWKMIEMENEYIKVWICPAIGGKVWGAIDKKTGKEFFYYNHVVKFRDVASRGPWTSGGLEMNFGVIGHAPWASSQVDYQITYQPNGNAVCTIGGLDVSLGTNWRVQLILPVDKAYLETKVLWYNNTSWEKPYYQWMNLGVKVSGDLRYQYPGNRYLTHDGKSNPWPKESGHRIDRYDENNFGHYKSYHVFGKATDFWGTYWKKDDFGMCHVTSYQNKLGKKIWIWGLSRYGMVWKNLLTDSDGQYTEVQSGKLFNQSIGTSYKTPFKHYSFQPGATYSWSEYWFPVQKIGQIDGASTKLAYSLKQQQTSLFNAYAVSSVRDTLKIISGNRICYQKMLQLNPTDTTQIILPILLDKTNYKVSLGKDVIFDSTLNSTSLSRPTTSPATFDYSSAYGLYLQGKEFERQNFLNKAEGFYKQSLTKDSYFIPTLVSLAGIYYGQNKIQQAWKLVRVALSINTYNGAANYLYALLAEDQLKEADAIDGFSVALLDPTYESVAAQHLAMLYLRRKDYAKASTNIQRSLLRNPMNIGALQLQVIVERLQGNALEARNTLKRLRSTDPMNTIMMYEAYLLDQKEETWNQLNNFVVNEYWAETFLSIASTYEKIGQNETAYNLLSKVNRQSTAIQYKKAYLAHVCGLDKTAIELLNKAEKSSPSLLFPHHRTDEDLYRWAVSTKQSTWKSNYYLGLLYLSMNRHSEALIAFEKCKNYPNYYAFYLTRAIFLGGGEKDYKKAIELSPKRFVGFLEWAKSSLSQGKNQQAVSILQQYKEMDKNNSYINLLLAKAYLKNRQYKQGIRLMKSIQVLPNEGSLEGRNVWRETNIQYAIQCISKKKYKTALSCIQDARLWPENLGVGKPYINCCDERLEDFLELYIAQETHQETSVIKNRLASYAFTFQPEAVSNTFTALALSHSKLQDNANKRIERWRKYSSKKAVRWGMAVYHGDIQLAHKIAQENEKNKVALPFEILFQDRDFVLILDNYEFFSDLLFKKKVL